MGPRFKSCLLQSLFLFWLYCLDVGVNKIAMVLTTLFSKVSKMLVLFKNVVVMHYMYLLIITDWFSFQHLSNGPVSHDISAHEEQMEEMQFVLDKRAKEVERVKLKLIENSSTVNSLQDGHPWDRHEVSVLERCLSYKESNKGNKQRQGPTLGVRFLEVSVL